MGWTGFWAHKDNFLVIMYSCWGVCSHVGVFVIMLGCLYSCWGVCDHVGVFVTMLGCLYSCWGGL